MHSTSMTRSALAATAALLFAGCESLPELRATPPVRTAQIAGQYDALAQCVANAADASSAPGIAGPTLRVDQPARTARVFRESQGIAVYDVRFAQLDGGLVSVEGRGMSTAHGRDFHLRELWPAMERCGGTTKR